MNRRPSQTSLRRRRASVAALAVVLVVLAPVCGALCGPGSVPVLPASVPVAAEPCPGHAAMAHADGQGTAAELAEPAAAHEAGCCGDQDAAPSGPERLQTDTAPLAVAASLLPSVLPLRAGPLRPPTDLARAQGPPLLQRTLRFRE